jgi:serine-threonine kinase receptor-associated protein
VYKARPHTPHPPPHPSRPSSPPHPHPTPLAQDGQTLATGGYESIVRLYDLARPDADPAPLTIPNFTSRIRKLIWTPDGRGLYMGSEDGVLRFWDLTSGTVVREVSGLAAQDPSKNGIMDMELNTEAGTMTVAVGQAVAFVDPGTLRLVRSHHIGRDVETASLHPVHRRTFLAGGSDVWVRLFDTDTGAELATQRGHHGKVHAVRFAPNGLTYTSGADDATIRVWRYEDPSIKAAAATAKLEAAAAAAAANPGVPAARYVPPMGPR